MKQKFLLALLQLLLFTNVLLAQIVINEVSITGFNGSESGDHGFKVDDWFELYNLTGSPIDLTGYYLSDNQNLPFKYEIPSGTISANGYSVFYANGLETGNNTSFKLDQADFTEEIVLSDPSGTLIDIYKIRNRTRVNHYRGRTTDGNPLWSVFTTATQGASNSGATPYPSYVDSPTPSPSAGFYTGSVIVTVPVPPGMSARYTTDSTDPTPTSPLYSSPLVFNQTTVFKVRLYDNSGYELESFVKTNTYFIDENHSLYVLSVSGKSNIQTLVNGSINLYPTGTFEWFDETGERLSTTAGNLNKHGQDSWAYPQRGFDIFVRDEAGYGGSMNHKFFKDSDREEFDRFIIRAAGDDNYPYEDGGAHIRDAFVQTWGGKSNLEMDYRTYRPCIVYLNGDYWGVYEIREKVVHKSFTSYYYNQDEDDLDYISYWGSATQRYGSRVDWDAAVSFILNNDMGVPANFDFIDGEINLLSLCDWALVNSYIVSKDWNNWNTAWWRGRNPDGGAQKWQYILWDMDASFGHYINYSNVPDITPQASPCDVLDNSPISDPEHHLEIFEKIIDENPAFHDFVANRYNDLLNTYWDCSFSIPLLDEMAAEKAPEMQRQLDRWDPALYNTSNNGTYAQWEDHLQDIRDFLNARCTYIDGGLAACLNLGTKYQLTFEVDPPEALAKIQTNTVTLPNLPLTGDYYDNLPLNVIAGNSFSYEFSHWTTQNGTVISDLNNNDIQVTVSQNDVLTAHYNLIIGKSLVVNEIHYNPSDSIIAVGDTLSGRNFEFVELKNTGSINIEMQGITFEKGITFTFEDSYNLAAGQFIVLAEDSAWFHEKYNFAADFVYKGKLENNGERILLNDQSGFFIDSVRYDDNAPWDSIPDNSEYSLALIDPYQDNSVASNWSIQNIYTTPKAENTFCSTPLFTSYNITDVSCNGYTDGSIVSNVSGGTGPYNYNWSNGETTGFLVNISAGVYTVNILDQAGCRGTDTLTVSEPDGLVITATVNDETAQNADDGSISLLVSGAAPPFTYSWSNNESTSAITNLAPGNYTVDITDNNGCITSRAYDILEYGCPNLSTSISGTNETGLNLNDGTASVVVNDPEYAPYSYIWNNGESTASVSGLIPGTYYVTTSGILGCAKTDTITILEYTCPDADNDNICDADDVCPNDAFDLCYIGNPCASQGGNSSFEYIGNVTFNTINNTSGNNGGYADYTNLSTTVNRNTSYSITLVPEFPGTVYNEYWNVWIDYNKDGLFDSGELVFNGSGTTTVSGSVTIDVNALLGNTIMRVKMDYTSSSSTNPCGTYTYGETEDYSLFIIADCGADVDSDNDGVCDSFDLCPNYNDSIDSNSNGIPDGCDNCVADADNDGVCDSLDVCPGFNDNFDVDNDGIPNGCDACPNSATGDTDNDGVCDDLDVCNGFDDNIDTDNDGIPDGCDNCVADSDNDGVCDDVDVCNGFDDNLDADNDGTPDGCDSCPNSATGDSDNDGVCDDVDVCNGFDDTLDEDYDGTPNGCDDDCYCGNLNSASITIPISSSIDDVEQQSDGSIYTNSSDIELIYDNYPITGDQSVGLRFANVAVPANSIISNAYIQFTADETNTIQTDLVFSVEDTDNAAVYATTNSEVTGRNYMPSTIAWNNVPQWTTVSESGANQRTPNLTTMIAAITSKTGWTNGNAIAFMIQGTGERTAEAYDGVQSSAAKLVIDFIPSCIDSDNDGTKDVCDVCPGYDDSVDLNANGIPDGCEAAGCPSSMSLSADPELTGTFIADDWITSSSKINSGSGGTVNFQVGDEFIELINGFDADGTVDFNAYISDCDLGN